MSCPEIGARAFIHPGFDFPPHATAAGKVVHAFSVGTEPPSLESYPVFQRATLTDPERLRDVYAQVLRDGFATNDSELDAGVYSMASPVFLGDHLAGALALVGPRDRMLSGGAEMVEATQRLLTSSARKLSSLTEAAMTDLL